jgi:hypothetical protein
MPGRLSTKVSGCGSEETLKKKGLACEQLKVIDWSLAKRKRQLSYHRKLP